ncbi:MAG: hypothetical protein VYC34_08435 [Planctomycetota bacterium]|nr:hypothetical protein [Planctomycetota bacterium]
MKNQLTGIAACGIFAIVFSGVCLAGSVDELDVLSPRPMSQLVVCESEIDSLLADIDRVNDSGAVALSEAAASLTGDESTAPLESLSAFDGFAYVDHEPAVTEPNMDARVISVSRVDVMGGEVSPLFVYRDGQLVLNGVTSTASAPGPMTAKAGMGGAMYSATGSLALLAVGGTLLVTRRLKSA